ncbi:hypothetical protein LJC53_06405, partial [Bacteroidales bacterium OttesenSCG-928-C03]|nr:hypothetical protein [Bacteroidales bacterium OttesenSCG-928-C03]
MKINIVTLMLFVSVNVSFGQTFIGKQSDKLNRYNCSFRINKDSSVNFIYDRDFNGIYADHRGTIKKLNDTLYRVSATMAIGQFYMKS